MNGEGQETAVGSSMFCFKTWGFGKILLDVERHESGNLENNMIKPS